MKTEVVLGLLLITLGLSLRYHIGKRRFKRRNIAGLQGFSSYSRALLIAFLEKIGNCVGLLAFLSGLLLLALAIYNAN
jgi:hypothetical protein